jgi:CDP-paratose 2-epimerase
VGDLYTQEYARIYGMKTAVFRMSCIFGTRQFGFEDQGWVAWFVIATLFNKPITIYGDGKQVRDLLYVTDLIKAYDKFIKSNLKHAVFNIGGGVRNTASLLEFLDILENETGRRPKITFKHWRPSDQKVYISDISKIKKELGWQPEVSVKQGVKRLITWVKKNRDLFV